MNITVSDRLGRASATITTDDLPDVLRAWLPGAPPQVEAAIEALQLALERGDDTTGLEEYLGVDVVPVPRISRLRP